MTGTTQVQHTFARRRLHRRGGRHGGSFLPRLLHLPHERGRQRVRHEDAQRCVDHVAPRHVGAYAAVVLPVLPARNWARFGELSFHGKSMSLVADLPPLDVGDPKAMSVLAGWARGGLRRLLVYPESGGWWGAAATVVRTGWRLRARPGLAAISAVMSLGGSLAHGSRGQDTIHALVCAYPAAPLLTGPTHVPALRTHLAQAPHQPRRPRL